MKSEHIETLIWIFCIIVLSSLSIKLYSDSLAYSCDNCTAYLSGKSPTEEKVHDIAEVNVKEVFEAYYNNNKCLISWDSNQGYVGVGFHVK